jgi:hypothetical protein
VEAELHPPAVSSRPIDRHRLVLPDVHRASRRGEPRGCSASSGDLKPQESGVRETHARRSMGRDRRRDWRRAQASPAQPWTTAIARG